MIINPTVHFNEQANKISEFHIKQTYQKGDNYVL